VNQLTTWLSDVKGIKADPVTMERADFVKYLAEFVLQVG
jgi:hypothetical protein